MDSCQAMAASSTTPSAGGPSMACAMRWRTNWIVASHTRPKRWFDPAAATSGKADSAGGVMVMALASTTSHSKLDTEVDSPMISSSLKFMLLVHKSEVVEAATGDIKSKTDKECCVEAECQLGNVSARVVSSASMMRILSWNWTMMVVILILLATCT